MQFKEDWEIAKDRLRALWNREIIDRCCVSVTAPKDGRTDPSAFAAGDCDQNDPADIRDYWENPERILKRNLLRMENTFFGGEAFPQIMLNFGTSGHASYFGADYKYREGTVWYEPVVRDWKDFDPVFDPGNARLLKQLEIARFLSDAGRGRFFVSMPDNCGTLDALGHLRGSDRVLMDLMEEPELVKRAIHALNSGWRVACEQFYAITRECNEGGSTIGWMDTWAEGRHTQMQSDMSVMFSKQAFREFVVPELEEQMEWNEYALYHLDGVEQIRHLDLLLELPKLRMIQWMNVTGQDSPAHFLPALKRIQQAGKGLLVFTPAADIPALLSELSSKGLYLHTQAGSAEEARSILEYAERHTRD